MLETNIYGSAVCLESWHGPTAIAELQTEAQWRLDDVWITFDMWIDVWIAMYGLWLWRCSFGPNKSITKYVLSNRACFCLFILPVVDEYNSTISIMSLSLIFSKTRSLSWSKEPTKHYSTLKLLEKAVVWSFESGEASISWSVSYTLYLNCSNADIILEKNIHDNCQASQRCYVVSGRIVHICLTLDTLGVSCFEVATVLGGGRLLMNLRQYMDINTDCTVEKWIVGKLDIETWNPVLSSKTPNSIQCRP